VAGGPPEFDAKHQNGKGWATRLVQFGVKNSVRNSHGLENKKPPSESAVLVTTGQTLACRWKAVKSR
jgi:hypothetical protein